MARERPTMSVATIGLLGVALLLLLIFLRVPIAVALAGTGLLGYAALDGWSPALKMFGLVPYQLSSAYSLSVIPLFILMGAVAARANMATELFQASNAVFSGIRGALANATIGACTLFGAICGSSIATAATFSRVAIPEMSRHGYEPAFGAGAVASAGTLGVLIPPSVLLAIYAIATEQSLVTLYAAAFVPGFILAALYVMTVFVVARARPKWIPKVAAMSLRARLRAAVGMWKLGILFFFAVFGIYLGWFSPTEAAALAAFVAIVIGFATRAMGWRGLVDALLETVYTTAAIFFIVVGAFIFARFIVLTQFPNELVRWVQAVGLSPFWILMAVIALYVLLGTFLDEVSTILITVPVTLPLVNGIGFDAIWFGIFVTVMCTIGLISPPTGMTVFVIQAQHPEIPVARIYLGTLPFLVADFVLVGLLIAMPALALWLPSVLR
jgi:tripartite ATP-independent transporter DctM subunit